MAHDIEDFSPAKSIGIPRLVEVGIGITNPSSPARGEASVFTRTRNGRVLIGGWSLWLSLVCRRGIGAEERRRNRFFGGCAAKPIASTLRL
jgi:hypothetical protein